MSLSIHCPKCGEATEVEENAIFAFCENCGAEISIEKTPAATPGNNESTILSNYESNLLKQTSISLNKGSWDLKKASLEKINNGSTYDAPSSYSDTSLQTNSLLQSDCPYIEIAYNKSRFLLANTQVTLELKITPIHPELKKLYACYTPEIAGEEDHISHLPIRQNLKLNKPISLRIPYSASEKEVGILPFRFYFICMLDEDVKYYVLYVEHQVYSKEQSAASVAHQIVMNIHASEAGSVNANVAEAARNLQGNNLSVNDIISKLNNTPSVFTPVPLNDTIWRPEKYIFDGNPLDGILPSFDKLTLLWNNKRIHLISKKAIKLGRTADSDIKIHNPKYKPNEHPNNTVSRLHADILYCGDKILLFDRSSHGTYIANAKVFDQKESYLNTAQKPPSSGRALPHIAHVEFGDIHWKMKIQFCEQRDANQEVCILCPAKRVKSVIFKRESDDLPESYAIVWECCELGDLYSELQGWTVFRRNGTFALRPPRKASNAPLPKPIYLYPGKAIEQDGISIKPIHFEQF